MLSYFYNEAKQNKVKKTIERLNKQILTIFKIRMWDNLMIESKKQCHPLITVNKVNKTISDKQRQFVNINSLCIHLLPRFLLQIIKQ